MAQELKIDNMRIKSAQIKGDWDVDDKGNVRGAPEIIVQLAVDVTDCDPSVVMAFLGVTKAAGGIVGVNLARRQGMFDHMFKSAAVREAEKIASA